MLCRFRLYSKVKSVSTYTYPLFSGFPPIWVTTKAWGEFPALYNRFPWLACFIHRSAYMSKSHSFWLSNSTSMNISLSWTTVHSTHKHRYTGVWYTDTHTQILHHSPHLQRKTMITHHMQGHGYIVRWKIKLYTIYGVQSLQKIVYS